MNSNRIYFKNLDTIRFIAALMVFLQHGISPLYRYFSIENASLRKVLEIISNGGLGVSIFFVLSGFLITYLIITEYELNTKVSVGNFYMRRVLRIWPLYFVVVAFTFLIYPFFKSLIGMNNPLSSNILYYVSFLSNFDVINIQKNFNGCDAMSQNVTWSVSVEEQFYLFWPLIFIFLPRRFWIYSVLLIIAGTIFFRFKNINDEVVLYFHTFSVLGDLCAGALMALLIKSNKKIRVFFEESSTVTHVTLLTISFCLLFWSDTLFTLDYTNALSRFFYSNIFCFNNFSTGHHKTNISF